MNFKVLAVALILSSTSFAQVKSEQDRYVDGLESNYGRVASSVAANSNGSDMYDVVMNWCQNQVGVLHSSLAQFRNHLYAGNNAAAFKALQAGLYRVSSSRSFGPRQSPFVKLASDRALLVSRKLQSRSSDLGALHALESLTRNVIDLAYKFDRDYYVSYRYNRCGGHCDDGFVERMEREALEFAQNQVDTVVRKLTTNVGREYRPIGHASVYLTAAEIIALNTANDLRNNIFASEIPCTIGKFYETGLQLRAFNQGNTSYYGSVRTAVDESASSLADASADIYSACYRRRW